MATPTHSLAWRHRDGDWLARREDFDRGQLAFETNLAPGGPIPILVSAGTFLWVVPQALYPEDARDRGPATFEIKRVVEIRLIPNTTRAIFSCTDYLRAAHLRANLNVDRRDARTSRLADHVAPDCELVETSRVSYIWQNRVEDVADVAILEWNRLSFPPLFPRQLYARTDISFELQPRGPNPPQWVARATPARYCGPRCLHARFYAPHIDSMRFCDVCNKWFHLDCLNNLRPATDFPIFEDDEAHNNDHQVSDPELTVWEHAFNTPITRSPRRDEPYTDEPFSIETILRPLRLARDDLTNSLNALPDLEDFVKDLPAVVLHPDYYRPDLIAYVLATTRNADVETIGDCPECSATL